MARILIVDDSAFTRRMLRRVCEDAGHEIVGRAASGDEALALFRAVRPELVTLDYLMPDKSGEAVLEEMIAVDPRTRVIMVSGSGDKTVKDKALASGAKAYLDKHRAKREILSTIDRVMQA